jgi:hypothetical protein
MEDAGSILQGTENASLVFLLLFIGRKIMCTKVDKQKNAVNLCQLIYSSALFLYAKHRQRSS